MGIQIDVAVEGGCGLLVLVPHTRRGREWLDEFVVCEPWQRVAGGVAVDGTEYASEIVQAMQDAGLNVA